LGKFRAAAGKKVAIATTLLTVILVLILCLPAVAQGSDTGAITITMTGANEISITLDKTDWPVGTVASNTEYETDPPIEWCSLNNTGNVAVNTFIVGEDAKWVDNPAYKWTLSSNGTSGNHIYGLWFRISGDTTRGYVPVTKTESEFWPYSGYLPLESGHHKQFGLRVLTPTLFYGGRQMQTHVTISAVAA
jgi:hypothetical protein